ncbi:hypothetical protein FGIG_10294 [Fasciola gigantica]|uniref:Uncharacterized protein n=1 Tax=Fasciola gigantica TaxID=46835 RepID=A0A504Y5P9_FASGI|nr:hypothetical protein FGIG_10294 [Fasciola gigantica]
MTQEAQSISQLSKVQLNRVTFQKPVEEDSYEFQRNPNVKISSEDNGERKSYCDSLLKRCYGKLFISH